MTYDDYKRSRDLKGDIKWLRTRLNASTDPVIQRMIDEKRAELVTLAAGYTIEGGADPARTLH